MKLETRRVIPRAGAGAVAGLLLAGAAWIAQPVEAAGKGEPGPYFSVSVDLADRLEDLRLLRRLDFDVEAVFGSQARVHVTREEIEKLRRLGYRVTELPPEPVTPDAGEGPPEAGVRAIPPAYHTFDTLTSELQAIAAANPDLTRLVTIGKTAQERELWVMKITRNPDLEEDEPEVAYVAAMHGDEVVGKELCIELIHQLVDGYGTDSRLTALVDGTEIWIMPSMNPDGTELTQRYNANDFDLNRNFPDWFQDPVNSPDGRQPETRAVMGWVADQSITLSANFHGGTLVANYPWDNNETQSDVFSPTPDPDQPAFYSISLTYAENNPAMYASPSFPNGVTNGAEWYSIDGGMQDWSYAWYGKFDVTMEISNSDWPPATELPAFWEDNQESMLSYLERAYEGVRGIVTDAATGEPLAAEVRLDADPFPVHTDPDVGDYHRIVLPGSYTMEVSAPGYGTVSMPVEVVAGPAVRYDAELQALPADLQPVSSRVEDGENGWLDPGETADLAVTLMNHGDSVTSVGGRLIPTGWHAEVVRADATYPDIGNQQTGETSPPHYAVHLDPGVPGGHRVGLAVEWTAAQGRGLSEPFFLKVGEPTCETDAATDVPQSILDYETTTSEVQVATGVVIDDLRVPVRIGHTYIGDLELTLTSPSGTEVVLHDRSGGGTDDIVGTYGVDLTPAEPLSLLTGEPADGTWSLAVSDLAGGDTGTLTSWSLEICGWPMEERPPEMRFRESSVEPGGVLLRWWTYPGLLSYRVYRSTDPGSAAAFADVTGEDGDSTDSYFLDASTDPLVFYLVTGVGAQGEGPKGHFGE